MALNLDRRGKGRSKPKIKRVSAAQLFKMIPGELLARIGEETGVDSNVSRLRGELMLQLLIIGQLQGDELSTRLLAELYNSEAFRAISGKGNHQTRHSSIASRLKTINAEYFEQIFQWLYAKFQGQFSRTVRGKQLKRFDSTLVRISSALVDYGMTVGPPPKTGPRTRQIKFTLELHGALPKSVKLFTDQAHLSEQTALREAITQAGIGADDLVVFDAGLTDRRTFVAFDEGGTRFVTRLKTNYRAQTQGVHRHIQGRQADGLRFVKDERVHLYATGNDSIPHDFRLVEAIDQETQRVLTFVTNIWDLSAMDIARIYRSRWDIEVFFRFLKQNLNFGKLVNRSENGIRVQMYAALITSILLIAYQHKNQIEGHNVARLRFLDELIVAFSSNVALEKQSSNPP